MSKGRTSPEAEVMRLKARAGSPQYFKLFRILAYTRERSALDSIIGESDRDPEDDALHHPLMH